MDSPDSNYGNAKRDLLDDIAIPDGQVHPMNGEMAPEAGAENYQDELTTGLGLSEADIPVFDLILLGVGEDGHVASLFPGKDEFKDDQWVVAVKGGVPDVHRLTLTYPVLNQGKHVILMAYGKNKAQIIDKIFNHRELNLPAHKIKPVNGDITWVLDKDASAQIK